MKVHWTKNAIDHLAGIFEYIEINSPTYARRWLTESPDAQSRLRSSHCLGEKCLNMQQKTSGK